jgi:quinol monooxygenase YgiN
MQDAYSGKATAARNRAAAVPVQLMTGEIFGRSSMVTAALFVRIEAKPGKERDVESFLRTALPLVEAEPATTAWFALRLEAMTFGIFDAFPDEAGRQAHLAGKVASALKEKTSELFAKPPEIVTIDVLAAKLP